MAEMMWAGRSSQGVDSRVNAFNSSIAFDGRMYKQDIQGSIAHATMLGEQGIISMSDSLELIGGLKEILADIESGKLQFDMTAEDIHMFIEAELTKRLGDVGKRLHTSRSRNDQVALDIRLYLRDAIKELRELVVSLVKVLCSIADENTETIMPGYTHLQRAQPITFGHHMMAYAQMLLRDIERFDDTLRRMNVSPLGSCALAGTTYHINRDRTAELLGMEAPMVNSLDGVSDRDFCILAMMKGLPLAYNKDMQEDKEAIFDAVDNLKLCLTTFIPMLETMTLYKDNMRKAAAKGFINATDCADYLVKKGMPFRTAYKITGGLVAHCIELGTTLEELPLADYQKQSDLFTDDVYEAISLDTCVRERKSFGGPAPESVKKQIELTRKKLEELCNG